MGLPDTKFEEDGRKVNKRLLSLAREVEQAQAAAAEEEQDQEKFGEQEQDADELDPQQHGRQKKKRWEKYAEAGDRLQRSTVDKLFEKRNYLRRLEAHYASSNPNGGSVKSRDRD